MKKWLMALVLGIMVAASPAQAKQELKPWQKKAIKLIYENYPRAKDVGWPNGTTSLWIFIYTPKFDYSYETVTSNIICPALDAAGRPKNTIVIVTYWSFEGAGVGKSKMLAKVPCE